LQSAVPVAAVHSGATGVMLIPQFPVGEKMAAWVGPAIAAGASLLGGALGRSSSSKAREAEGVQRDLDRQLQREFAQSGIRWKVNDAKLAGIHPLYALGAQTHSFAPTSAGVSMTGDPFADSLQSAGQDIGRAVQAGFSKPEKHTLKMRQLAEERGELENALLRSQIAKNSQTGPALPSAVPDQAALPGQHDAPPIPGRHPGYKVDEVSIPAVNPGQPHTEAGAIPEGRWVRRQDGGYILNPSESSGMQEMDLTDMNALGWYWRNRIIPRISSDNRVPPPKSWLPKGAKGWRFDWAAASWYPDFGTKGPNVAPSWFPGTIKRLERR
jgi:hypothetical protein